MRQFIPILIIIILTNNTFGQVICPRDNYDLLNYHDTINRKLEGLRQGLWINYNSTLACNDCNDCNGARAILKFSVDSKGYFKNDVKVGQWSFYKNNKLSRVVKFDNGQPDSIESFYDLNENLTSVPLKQGRF